MNKAEKLIQKQFLNDEEAIIRRLKTVYNQSYKDITGKISSLDMSISALQKAYADIGDEIGPLAGAVLKGAGNLTPDQAKETVQSMIQSKVYQKTYQEALKSQVDDVLGKMLDKEYTAVSDYLTECYENGFIGTMMNFQSQGIPLIMPIDQEAMVRAVQLDSPISEGLYKHLGEDVGLLKRRITAEVSRGISTGMTYSQVAEQISRKMMGTYENPGGSLAYASRIARTEGHRIQVQSSMDACYKAKDKGADVVKQWDSTLDGRTRDSHTRVDGEIRDLDEKFSNGLRYPGDSLGGAAEVVNCRCALLQRAKWALDEDELETLKERAAFFGLDKTDNFQDYKAKYLKAAEGLTNSVKNDIIKPNLNDKYMKDLVARLKYGGVEYREVAMHDTPLSEQEIIDALGGGDLTRGSCASLGLAYAGQKGGMNVLDFRDGTSRNFFSTTVNLETIAKLPGVKTITETAKSAVTAGNKLLKHVELDKEYYFVSGRHAAIVRKTKENGLQYLELQSATRNGWHNFDEKPRNTLSWRFGDYRLGGFDVESFMIEVDSIKDSDDLRYLLGYINTSDEKQRKGKHGTIK